MTEQHPSDHQKKLLARIQDRSAVVGVVGLGYVGLPLAVEFGVGDWDAGGREPVDDRNLPTHARDGSAQAGEPSNSVTRRGLNCAPIKSCGTITVR